MKTIKNILFYILLFSVAPIYANPFGLEMGMSIDEIDGAAELLVSGKYKVSVSRLHSAFEAYAVTVGGFCAIKGNVGKMSH